MFGLSFCRPFGILLGYFYYERLIGILIMGFLETILHWDFRFLDTDFLVGLMLYHCL